MSARIYGGPLTITATATSLGALLTTAEPTIVNLVDDKGVNAAKGTSLLLRAATTNAAVVYFGFESNVTPGTSTVTAAGAHAIGYIGSGEAIEFHVNTWIALAGIFAIGTANDIVYLAVADE